MIRFLTALFLLSAPAFAQSTFDETCDCNHLTPISVIGAASPTQVTISFVGTSSHIGGWENGNAGFPSQTGAEFLAANVIFLRACGVDYYLTAPTYTVPITLGPFDGVVDYAGTSGTSWSTQITVSLSRTIVDQNSPIMSCFAGTGAHSADLWCCQYWKTHFDSGAYIYGRGGMHGTYTVTVQ